MYIVTALQIQKYWYCIRSKFIRHVDHVHRCSLWHDNFNKLIAHNVEDPL